MSTGSPHLEKLRISGSADPAIPGEPSQPSSVQRSDDAHGLSSPAAASFDESRRQLSITEAEEISMGLRQYFAQPAEVQAGEPQTETLGVAALAPRRPPPEMDEIATRLSPKDLFHMHWMARAMSADSAKRVGAARVEQNTKVHWIGLSLSSGGVHEASAVVAMEQWLKNSDGGICTPLVSMPIDHALPPTATGKRTTMQPYPLCSVRAAPPLPSSFAGGDTYAVIGNSDLYPTAKPSGSRDATERGAIDDSTAELLRPLLRQWLNDNMGLMVEKALAAEAAENAHA